MLEFIIYGLIHEGDWDLTQPQATLLAGVISGVLLIAAAYIAFHGQREQRREESRRHGEMMKAQRDQFDDQIAAQRNSWSLDQKSSSDRSYRSEVREVYIRVLRIHEKLLKVAVDARYAHTHGDKALWDKLTTEYVALSEKELRLDSERSLVQTSEINLAIANLNKAHMTLASEPSETEKPEDVDVWGGISNVTILMRQHLASLLPDGEIQE